MPSTESWGSTETARRSFGSRPSGRCSGGGRAGRTRRSALLHLQPGLRDQYAGLTRLPHRVSEPMLLDPGADLEIAVGVEELGGHRDQLGDLAVVVLELEHLRVSLEVEEVVDRAQRKLTLQVTAHDRNLRLVERRVLRLVERRTVEELPPLGRQLAVGRQG